MRTVETVRATLRAALDPPPDAAGIAIDCSAATEIDLTFVQLLIATRLSALREGKAVSLTAEPNGALLDTLIRGGFRVARDAGPEAVAGFWFDGAAA